MPANKCLKIVDLEILSCETAIAIRDFQSKYWNALRTGLVLLLHRNAALPVYNSCSADFWQILKWGRQQCTVSSTQLGPQRTLEKRQTALQGGCKHVSICTCFFIPVFDSFSATGWAIKTVQICSKVEKNLCYFLIYCTRSFTVYLTLHCCIYI